MGKTWPKKSEREELADHARRLDAEAKGSAELDESTRVWIVGKWGLEELGPTPVDAPYLANELAQRVLARLPPDIAVLPPTLAIEMATRDMLTFSFELDAGVLEQLATIGSQLDFRLNTTAPDLRLFGRSEVTLGLESYTGNRDPARVTTALGVEPTTLHRAGDLRGVAGRWRVGTWRLERERALPIELDTLVRELCDGLGTDLPARCPDEHLKIRMSLLIGQLAGGFTFSADSIARLAALRVALGIYFYNFAS